MSDLYIKCPSINGCNKVYKKDIINNNYNKYNSYNIYNKVWYKKLVANVINNNVKYNGFYNYYKAEDLISHLVVCLTKNNNTYVEYLYAYFDSYIEFFE